MKQSKSELIKNDYRGGVKQIICIFIALLLLLSLTSCSNALTWPSSDLGKMLPKLEGASGEIHYENAQNLYIVLSEVTKEQYVNYIHTCQSKGFTVDIIQDDNSYLAYNQVGYKLELDFFSDGDLWINFDAPIPMSNIQWPTTDIAQLLPKPESSFGKIEWSNDSGFVIYVGRTTSAKYNAYVDSAKLMGFTENVNSGNDFYYASNCDGHRLTLKFEGFNTMFVRIDVANNNDNANKNSTTNSTTSTTSSTRNTSTTNPGTENLSAWQTAGKGVGGILPEPKLPYSLPQYSNFIAAEVEGATYAFFEDYVNQCIRAGFKGGIGAAESPDYYFHGETTNGERVQVLFYESEKQVSISAFPAK